MIKLNNKKAFTLAEVLLTLTIIGLVAMLTIPNMIQSTNDAPMKLAWKQAFSIISQVTYQMHDDRDGSLRGLCSDLDHNCFKNVFSNYVTYIKSANGYQSYNNCISSQTKFLNGSAVSWAKYPCLALNNGMFMLFSMDSGNCTSDYTTGGSI